MSDKDIYLSWLNDAYGLETSLVSALQNHAKDASNFPELQNGLTMHMQQTQRHAELVKGCIERLGGSTSGLKSGMSNIGGQLKNMMNAAAADEVVKNTLDDFTAENLEIASYTSLLAAAEQFGDQETARVCRQILQDEETAAALVKSQLPLVTLAALQKQVAVGS